MQNIRNNSFYPKVLALKNKPKTLKQSHEFVESVIETVEIISDPEQMKQLRRGINDMKNGKTVKWEKVKAQLGL